MNFCSSLPEKKIMKNVTLFLERSDLNEIWLRWSVKIAKNDKVDSLGQQPIDKKETKTAATAKKSSAEAQTSCLKTVRT